MEPYLEVRLLANADDASRDRLPFTSVGDHLMPGASDTESPDLDARALAAENVALTEELHRVKAREARLERLALHDPLTGLLNRLAFTEALETELARAERGSYPVALVVLDVDLFKQVNDLFGHAVGDEVLRGVAERLAHGMRPGDLCGRLGGDEFALGLVDTTAEIAESILSRLRMAISSLELGPAQHYLSLSAGVAEFPRHGVHVTELWSRADAAMYRAKTSGRDRYCVTSAEECAPPFGDQGMIERQRLNVRNAVEALARAVEARNGFTHLHSHAVALYAVSLARALGLDAERVELVRAGAVLHDVGKIGVPEEILWKDGPLTEGEFLLMRHHSEVGQEILLGAGLPEIADWVAHLHERFDGGGYPAGLLAEAIPLESRILKVADALDAMTSTRVYRETLGAEEALAELRRGAGTEFDPRVVATLLGLVRSGDLELRRAASPTTGTT